MPQAQPELKKVCVEYLFFAVYPDSLADLPSVHGEAGFLPVERRPQSYRCPPRLRCTFECPFLAPAEVAEAVCVVGSSEKGLCLRE